ncbi:MAG: PfkB family carbohydrate kinase [Pyrinomonadaceae bacterium]
MMDISEATSRFSGKRIAIIGDLVADQFLNGTISRVSREAPVFILRHENTVTLPGAAANAAANVASLGATPILFGAVGTDNSGSHLTRALEENRVATDYVISDPGLTTTTKIRVLAGQHYAARQQVIRIDYENSGGLSQAARERLLAAIADTANTIDAFVISDYGYGVVSEEIYEKASEIARRREIPIVVDSRYHLGNFAGATAATPNREEVEQIAGEDFTRQDCHDLREQLGFSALLVTNGNKGMSLFQASDDPLDICAVGSPEPVDVTGAGDTVIAAFTLSLASGLNFADAARVANHAGGIVVMKKGTATVTRDELLASIPDTSSASATKTAIQ